MSKFLLESLLQRLRIQKILPYINTQGIIVDLGCDHPPVLLQKIAPKMTYCVGFDENAKYGKKGNIEIFRQSITKNIKIESESTDYVTMLAVLEHLKHPKEIIEECYRILKPGGKLLITVPSPYSKPILELFAKMRLVRPEMIDQHENYFQKQQLQKMIESAGFASVQVNFFEFGLNICVCAIK